MKIQRQNNFVSPSRNCDQKNSLCSATYFDEQKRYLQIRTPEHLCITSLPGRKAEKHLKLTVIDCLRVTLTDLKNSVTLNGKKQNLNYTLINLNLLETFRVFSLNFQKK